MMNVDEFISKLRLAESCKTLYVKGCFGAPMTAANKKRYGSRSDNKNRVALINAASVDTFGFDCVCLIKAALGLWNADKSKQYGGTQVNKEANGISYGPDHVPDVGADGIVKYMQHVSTDFSNIIPGEVVWMSGHVGVYVGDGKVIECTPKWTNDVQYSNLGNLGYKTGNWRTWTKHGRLPWVEYKSMPSVEKPKEGADTKPTEAYYTVKKGDTLSKIALNEILKLNPEIKDPSKIYVGQKIRIS